MTGPLAGVRVADFGQYVAGPLAAVMLADQGADVVHVDPPGGPRLAGPPDAFLNRGKRRVVLDLKDPADAGRARDLVAGCDVVVENFRPGVMSRLGLDPAAARAADPALIWCSLPGFAAGDPRAGMRAWEGVVHAATADTVPRAGEEPDGWDWTRPTYTALPLPSSFAAYLAATAVVMALIARHRTGRGQQVEVPLFDAMFTLIGRNGCYSGDERPRLPAPLHIRGSGAFRCRDGRYVQFDALNPRHLTWFARAAGLTGTWDPRLLDPARNMDPEVNEQLHARLRELFATRTALEWEALGNEAGAVVAFVRTPQEWIATGHARASGAVARVDDPVLGPVWTAGLPVTLERTAAGAPRPRHLPGADTAAVLAGIGSREVPQLPPPAGPDLDHPLAGIRVLDLGVALAGPTCGRLLGEFGADVVKVGPPSSGPGGYLNRGKQSLLADLGAAAGREVFFRLAERADVVLENFSPSTADRLGIGYDEVRARRRDVVYTTVSCYGLGGPWTSHRGWEREGQAVTGIMERTGLPSVLGPYNPVDIGTGILATFATGLALFHRFRTGEGQRAGASLAQTATYHQALFTFDYPGYVAGEPRGYEALGEGPLNRFYRASDGWLYVAAPGQQEALGKAVDTDLSGLQGAALEAALEAAFASRPAAQWVQVLRGHDIAAHENVAIEDLMDDDRVRARGLAITQEVDGIKRTMPGLSVRLSATPARVGAPPVPPGASAAGLLEEIGMSDRLEELHRRWVVRSRDLGPAWSDAEG